MEDQNPIIMTAEGLKELEEELDHRKVTYRKEIADKLRDARAQGDLSENAEYDAAKEEQAHNEDRINEIEEMLKHVVVYDDANDDKSKINIGSNVTILDVEYNEELTYKIVGTSEANSLDGKISNESPVGRALLGHTAGDTVTVETEAGDLQYKVLDVSRSA